MGGEIICSICFEEYQSADAMNVVSTNCGHVFHENCLKVWQQRSATCPECRTNCCVMKRIFPTFKESANKGMALSTQLESNLKILSETQKNLLQSQRKIMELCEKLENLQLVLDSEVKENAILKRNIESVKEHAISADAKLNFEKELQKFTAVSNAHLQELCYQFLKENHEKLSQLPQLEDACKNSGAKNKNSITEAMSQTAGLSSENTGGQQNGQDNVVYESTSEIKRESEMSSMNWPNLGRHKHVVKKK